MRLAILKYAATLGAAYVDVEYLAAEFFFASGFQLTISYSSPLLWVLAACAVALGLVSTVASSFTTVTAPVIVALFCLLCGYHCAGRGLKTCNNEACLVCIQAKGNCL